ncbi:MAG: tetratricopeptide repeat protein [Blastocatellia bacterium]|nr:tetratricopeptide repeat protein [Blastocatellia bacterium]
MFRRKAHQILALVLAGLMIFVYTTDAQQTTTPPKPVNDSKRVGVGVISAFPNADKVEAHLRNYLGQMRGIKYILQPSIPEELFEQLALLTKDGKQIDLLVIAGHGAAQFPNIKLRTKSVLPKDVDVTYQQDSLKKKLQERVAAENTICTLRQKPKLTEDEQIALEQAQSWLENTLPEQIETFRRMLEAYDRAENAMAPDAKIWLLNCSAAATPTGQQFVKNLGRILLRKRGGTVIASKTDIDLMRPQFWASGDLSVGEYGVKGDWATFSIAAESDIKPFLNALPVNFAPACVDLITGKTEKTTLAPVVAKAEDSKTLKYQWQLAAPIGNGETASFSISDMMTALVKSRVKVTDQRGREGEGIAYISACKLQIKLSTNEPAKGTTIRANAVITNAYPLPANAIWKWTGKGGIKPKPGGKEIVEVAVEGDGELELQLERPDEPNPPRLLAMAKVPIKAIDLTLGLSVPAEVMETDIFSASVNVPAAAHQKAKDGKVTASWSPVTVGPPDALTAQLQFLKVEKDKPAFVFVNLNTGEHADKPVVVKPAKFAGSAAGSWNVQGTPGRTIALERTPAKIEQHINFNGPAIARASVGGKVEAWLGQLEHYYGEVNAPDPARVDKQLREKLQNEKGELKALAMGDFKGYIVETKPVFSRGSWSEAGFRECGVGAYGHGFATKGWALIEVRYNISGSGWFDNRFQSFMEAQAAAGQAEARAIVSSLKLTPTGEITKTPYTGPSLNVTLPAEKNAEPTPPKPAPPTTPKPTTPTTPKPTTPATPPPVTGGEAAAKSDALLKEGTALHDQKKYTEAISSFTKALTFTPNSAEAYRRRAMSKRELKDFAGAIADFSKAIAIDPNNARSYAGRGLAKERSGDVNGAVSDYTRAIQIDPRYENAYFYRALVRYDQKDYRGALADYEQVVALNPKNAGAWNNRGSAKEKLGDVAGALRDYEQAVALDPNNEVARRNVERLRAAAGNTSGSKKDSGLIDLGGTQWNWSDPKADAVYALSGNELTITAPNGNDLWYQYNVDAPRLVKRVNGNFVVQVRVRGEFRDNYNGAGLVVYAGRDAVIRFERGNQGVDGGPRVWILGYQNQREIGRQHIPFTANDVYLKLERSGNQFTGSVSSNGANWTKVGTLSATFPATVDAGLALVNQHNNNTLRATFSELELTEVTGTAAPTMPTATIGGRTTWGTIYQPNSKGDPFAGGSWTNARSSSDWLQRDFDSLYSITEIRIATAGTDVTTKGGRLVLKLQLADGQWVTVDELRETNINLEKLSFGGLGHSIPTYRKVLPTPITAKAFRLELYGNGWFSASDIKLIGKRL